jgi:hypothetical protein
MPWGPSANEEHQLAESTAEGISEGTALGPEAHIQLKVDWLQPCLGREVAVIQL